MNLRVQVRPRLLVLDTNVLVDHLSSVQTLAKEGSLGLRVPQVLSILLTARQSDQCVPNSGRFENHPDFILKLSEIRIFQ